MESLDEVIDAMIADRVIHRHRRIWLLVIALVVVAALIVLATGGWKEKKGRTVPTLTAPATVTAGRFEYNVTKAEIVRKPKGEYSDAETTVQISLDAKNIDSEKHETTRIDSSMFRLVPGGGADVVEPENATCKDDRIGWRLVYGLPPEACKVSFKVDPEFTADEIEIGILGEHFEGDNAALGVNDEPYWHNEDAAAVVRLKPEVVIDKGGSK